MTRAMLASFLVLTFACGAPPKKKEEPLIESEEASGACCCRIETDTPEDPTFTKVAVMECSVRRGVCLKTETQCEGQTAPTEPGTDPNAPPPTSF